MKAASSSQPQLVLRPVRKGGPISVQVQGGYVRREAPCDGIAIETDEHSFFVPADSLEEALGKLGRDAGRKSPAARR